MPSSTRSLATRRSGNTKLLFTLYHYNLEPMQPAVPRVPQAVLFLAAAKAPKQLPVECQTPANSNKTKKSAFLDIFTQFCGIFAELLPIFLHFWAILVTFACVPAPAPRHPINQPLPELPRPRTLRSATALLALPLKIDLSDNDIPIERLPRADNKLI